MAKAEVPPPSSCPLQFEFTLEAASTNSSILEGCGFDLSKFINDHPGSIVSYGSKLRPLDQLRPLLQHHPNFERFAHNHTHGISYPIDDLSSEECSAMLTRSIERGNHKSALDEEHRPVVTKLMAQDVEFGYGIFLTVESLTKIDQAEVYPVGCQDQLTINELGNVVPKKRVTHDLSFNRREGKSVNQRVREEELPNVAYGHAMLRFLHLIHHLRWHHPNERILCNKIDIEKAYRRLHTSAAVATKCIAVWFLDKMWNDQYHKSSEQVAVLLTRLPFGSSPAPAEFCVTSEMAFDLAGDLLNCDQWDPEILPSPYASQLPMPALLPAATEFGQAMEADVKLDPSLLGGTEGYIDDGACAVLDAPWNWRMVQRAAQAVVMALFLIFRPLCALLEPIPRPDPASIRKMLAEGGLKETVTFLGWFINTRRLTIALPREKSAAWSSDIRDMMKRRKQVKHKQLQSLNGKLNHMCFIIPDARHFMNNLRKMEYLARFKPKIKLSHGAMEDLRLWLSFIESAEEGISINRVVFRKPTIVTYSDASEAGIGGYCPKNRVAWRHRFTEEENKAFTLNCKEYLASAIDMDFQLELDPDPAPFPCILNETDSTTAMGWIRKSNHDPEEAPVHGAISRFHATNMLKKKACNFSQHLPGNENIVADSFSRDFHLSDDQIVTMLTSLHPSLNASHIKVQELPQKYTSMIASLAQQWPGKKESPKEPIKSTIAAGVAGWTSSNGSTSRMIPTWKESFPTNVYASAALSCMQYDGETSGRPQCRGGRHERPSSMWRRSSHQVVGTAPSSTHAARSTPT